MCSSDLFIAVRGPLTIAASLVAEHRLQTRRLSSCGSRAQSLRGMWDLPRPGLEPVPPALTGRLSTTAIPGKPRDVLFNLFFSKVYTTYLLCFCLATFARKFKTKSHAIGSSNCHPVWSDIPVCFLYHYAANSYYISF